MVLEELQRSYNNENDKDLDKRCLVTNAPAGDTGSQDLGITEVLL